MSRSGILSLVVVVVVALMVWFGLRGTSDVQCTICMTWNGTTECADSAGSTQQEAIDRARTAICAVLTQSRADNINCGNQEPTSVECN